MGENNPFYVKTTANNRLHKIQNMRYFNFSSLPLLFEMSCQSLTGRVSIEADLTPQPGFGFRLSDLETDDVPLCHRASLNYLKTFVFMKVS